MTTIRKKSAAKVGLKKVVARSAASPKKVATKKVAAKAPAVRKKAAKKAAKVAVRTTQQEILGVTFDGVRILKPRGHATHFSDSELRDAIGTVMATRNRG